LGDFSQSLKRRFAIGGGVQGAIEEVILPTIDAEVLAFPPWGAYKRLQGFVTTAAGANEWAGVVLGANFAGSYFNQPNSFVVIDQFSIIPLTVATFTLKMAD